MSSSSSSTSSRFLLPSTIDASSAAPDRFFETSSSSSPELAVVNEPTRTAQDFPPVPGRHAAPSSTTRTLAPNLTRRSHKKSRGGCFNCKHRKIKCSESRPACGNCLLKDLKCEYPSVSSRNNQLVRHRNNVDASSHLPASTSSSQLMGSERAATDSSLSLSLPLTSTSETFSLHDMRFFHHFLTVAYPHLPLGNDAVWTHEIPKIAHAEPYLMSAMLALGASHLDRLADQPQYETQAIMHRGRAIAGLNRAIAQPSHRYGEGDAMLATTYALSFQAAYIGDGMVDFLTMVRGCGIITQTLMASHSSTAFSLGPNLHFEIMEPCMNHMPAVDSDIVASGTHALEELVPLLKTSTEHRLHTTMTNILVGLGRSSRAGYLNFIALYSLCHDLSSAEFAEFVNTDNMVMQTLMSYFVALHMIMVPLTQHEWVARYNVARIEALLGIVEWAERIFARLPGEMARLVAWPRSIIEIAKQEIRLPPCTGSGEENRTKLFKIRMRMPVPAVEELPAVVDVDLDDGWQ